MWIYLVIAAAVVAADQLTKHLVIANLELYDSIDLIPGVFRLTYIQNEGAAFGMLGNARWLFIVASSLVIIGILWLLFSGRVKNRLLCVSLGLILGGGIGNMVDRLFYGEVFGSGKVVDFLDFYLFPFWTWIFNVADACVVVGTGLLILYIIISMVKENKENKQHVEANSNDDGQDGTADGSGGQDQGTPQD